MRRRVMKPDAICESECWVFSVSGPAFIHSLEERRQTDRELQRVAERTEG